MFKMKIKNLGSKAEIYIYGIIVDDTDANFLIDDDGEILGYQFPAEIKKQLDDLKGIPIDVHVASDGGNVAAGIAIYNMLVNHDAPVTVYVDSWAASIASVICFAGQKIVMPENTFLMIHNPMGGGFGEADYLRSIADWLDKLRNMIAETYAKFSEKSVDEIKSLMDKETWFTAKEASEFFKTVELVDSNEIEAVAQYKTHFQNAPENLLNKVKVVNVVEKEEKPTDDNVDDKNKDDVVKIEIIKVLQEAYKL